MYKLLYYLKRVYVGGFSYDMLLECQKYSGFPGNGCKQSSAQLINDTLSGKKKMPSKLF